MRSLVSLLCSMLFLSLGAQELLPDGSFEQSEIGKPPKGWYIGRANGAQSVVEVIGGRQGTDGNNALRIVSRTPAKPHRFTHVTITLPLTPGERYRLSYKAKGKNVGSFNWSFGKSWKERFSGTTVSEKFEPFTYDFTAKPEEFEKGKYKIQILADDIADELLIDEISVTSLAPRTVSEQDFVREKIWPVSHAPADWANRLDVPPGVPVIRFDAAEGNYTGDPKKVPLSGSFALAAVPEGVVVWMKVNDPLVRVRQSGAMWSGDSVQLRIDPTGQRTDTAALGDLELGFAPEKDGVNTWCWQFDRPLRADECSVSGGLTQNGYRFRALLTWKLLAAAEKNPDRLFSFNFIVNNDDGSERRVWFLAPGIHTPAKSSAWNLLAWERSGKPQMRTVPDEPAFWKTASGRLFLTGIDSATSQRATLVLRDCGKTEVSFVQYIPAMKPSDVCRLIYNLDAGKLENGPVELTLSLENGTVFKGGLVKRNVGEELRAGVANAKLELSDFSARRAEIHAQWTHSNYLEIYFYLIERHIGFLERDLGRKYSSKEEEEYYQRICEVELTGVNESLSRLGELLKAGASGKAGLLSWRYVSSPAVCRNGYFSAEAMDEKGDKAERPLLFAGYGHFRDVARDLPVLDRVGANLIQIELGPSRFFLPPKSGQGEFDNLNLDYFHNYIEKTMRDAWLDNVKIALLISPHYPFAYFVNKDRANTHDGNGRYVYYHRGNRPMIEAYVKALFAELRKSSYKDAIESIVLTNEPNMRSMTMESCFLKPEFEAYVNDRFGSLEGYNKLTGKHYASLDALLSAGEGDPVARYAFHCFKREFFAEWHKWLAGLVHDAWPGIPTSAKVMALHNHLPSTYGDAVDLELFGEITEINGNDNFCYYDSARWGSNWPRLTMSCDVQYSLRKNAIANTENHVIPDGTKGPVNPRHVYVSTMQQFMHGTGTVATWVWVDLDYPAYCKAPIDLRGGVFRRPSAILAQSEALLDANRVAADIVAFNAAPEQVGILYSPTNIIYNINSVSAPMEELYTLLNFCGHKVGFLSERKIAEGDFRDYKVLFLPAVWNIDRKAAEKLVDFVKRGGRVYTWKGVPEHDEFNRPLKPEFSYSRLPENLTETEFYRTLEKTLAVIPRKAPVKVLHHTGNIGVVTREANADGVTYLNLTNYNREPRIVELPFHAKELLSGREMTGKVEMAPLDIFLLKVE